MMDYTGDTGNKGTRWVCPNDRHLALRAKLRTGWSVKTGSLDSRSADYSYSNSYPGSSQSSASSFVLSDEERQTIIEVIRRAEALDLSEQERVGKLVERLENMKRNVTSVTTIRSNGRSCGSRCSGGRCICSCALCGERFAVLGAGPSLCKDCRKYICQKCGIEATPSSAPPFTPTFSTARGNIIPQGIQRTNVQKVFLCRICSETREMWKKSGAWFFKGLPKYVLPEKKVERGRPRAGSRASGWAVAGGIRPLETLEQDSSSDEDATRRLAVTRSLSASAGEAGSNEMATIAQLHEDKYQEHSSISSSRTSPSYHRQSSAPGFEMDYYNSNSGYGESFQSQIPSSASTAGLGFQGSRNVNNFPGQQTSVDDLRKSSVEQLNGSQVHLLRRDSMDSSYPTLERNLDQDRNRYSDWDQESLAASSDYTSNNINHSEQFKTVQRNQTNPMESGQGYGTLEVSLRYDPAAQCLQCRVERARGLRPMDIHGLADPFCKLNILPILPTTITKRLRTKTVHKTRDPEFNETLNFYGTTETDMKNGSALHVLILQDDPAGRDFLGEAKFPLHELLPYQMKQYNVFLENHYTVDQEEKVWGEGTNPRGQIQVSLSYSTRRRALLVMIHSAANLLPMDSNGFSDPFVKLCLTRDPKENSTHHTRSAGTTNVFKKDNKKQSARNTHSTNVKWKTLNPEWNEEFAFETRLTDLTSLMLSISVWDKDFGKSNDYLGGLMLSCSSKGARLRHWIDAIKFPDHRHRAWHNLTEATVATE
ncbi:rabphilin-3A isoform X1 [Cephus cinctus]|uniref:Rabphilin-3A isoform X1 n=1 Tax=Cephus cinctus TaxID=211228 RepID=A0AAJ7BRU6_CEPCN|nr:rabphilin-3A isoform X1 [Cephus cinctus]